MLIDQAELIRRVSAQAVSTARQHLPFSVFTDLNDQLLTSIEQYLFTLRWPALRVVAAKGQESAGGYLMDHSRVVYLMDPAGQPIDMIPVDKGAEASAASLQKWVR